MGLVGLALLLTRKDKQSWRFLGLSVLWYLAIMFVIKPDSVLVFIVLISAPLLAKFLIDMKNSVKGIDIKYASIMILWFVATVYASTKGIRFSLLLMPAFSVAFAVAVGFVYNYLSQWIIQELKINKILVKVILIILLSLLLIGPWASSKAIAKNNIPMVNDAWFNSLDKIRVESEPDAIINSWWDYGHWFKFIGDRAVTFDGTSQNTPQAYWIGKALLTNNETIAAGILRMLDCSGCECNGGNNAYSDIFEITNDTPKTMDVLNEIIPLKKEKAEADLAKDGFDESKINDLLSHTHCEAPENYFITSDDMIGKSGVWAHFGSWDFNKALMYNTFKEGNNDLDLYTSFLQNRFNLTYDESKNTYNEVKSIMTNDEANSWIAPWPSYIGTGSCAGPIENVIRCDIIQGASAYINLTTMQADVPTNKGVLHPDPLVYVEGKDVKVKRFENNSIGFGMTLVPDGGGYKIVMSSSELADSMFTRLYYLKGHGLRYFKPFNYEKSFNGNEIYVWKVDWNGTEKNIVQEFMPTNETAVE